MPDLCTHNFNWPGPQLKGEGGKEERRKPPHGRCVAAGLVGSGPLGHTESNLARVPQLLPQSFACGNHRWVNEEEGKEGGKNPLSSPLVHSVVITSKVGKEFLELKLLQKG